MTFLELQQDTFRRTNKATSPDTETVTRIKSYINQHHRTLMATPGMDEFRRASGTFASVASTPRVALTQSLTQIETLYETTNNRRLMEKSIDWLRTVNPQQDSGTPMYYIPKGYEYVAAQPSDASQLWITSDSTSDLGTLSLQGLRTGGIQATATAVMNGTTPVQVSAFADWIQVDKVWLDTAAVGTVTLSEDSSVGSALAQITRANYRPYYFVILLWPTPAGVLTYSFDYQRRILNLVEDTDEPFLPDDFHDLLSIGARRDEYEKMDDSRFNTATREYDEKLSKLQYFIHGRPSERLIPRSTSGRLGYSDLGGNYPSDFYVP